MANRNIFRAIHERKWLSIEYKNGKEESQNTGLVS